MRHGMGSILRTKEDGTMSNDTQYVYTSGDYSVLWCENMVDVVQSRNGVGHIVGTYLPNSDGLGLAIALARYKNGVCLTNNRDARKAEARFCVDEGKRIFALGVRKAHKEWLEQ